MKKERALALNHAFIAFIVLGVIMAIAYVTNTPLTKQAYWIPTYYRALGGVEYTLLPQLPIYWLVIIGPLFVFGVSYIINEWRANSKLWETGFEIGGTAGIVFGTLIGLLAKNSVGIPLGLYGGIAFGVFALAHNKPTGLGILAIFAGATTAGTNILITTLFRTSLGIGEAVVYGGATFLTLIFLLITINAVLPLGLAIFERMHLVVDTPEMKGTPRTAE